MINYVANYLEWLRGLVDGWSPDHDIFFDVLWGTEFIVEHPDDWNRVDDGLLLRQYFCIETAHPDLGLVGPCSVLELLIGLAKRLNEATYDYEKPNQIAHWFWVMIENLGFQRAELCNLEVLGTYELNVTLSRFMERKYQKNGSEGGLFPISGKSVTCSTVTNGQDVTSLWQQMQNYLMEIY